MAGGGWRDRSLWRVTPYLRPYRAHLTYIVISSIVSSAGMIAIPLIVKTVIDGPLADGDRSGVVRWAGRRRGRWRSLEVFLAFGRRYLLTLVATGPRDPACATTSTPSSSGSTSASTTAGSRASSCRGR